MSRNASLNIRLTGEERAELERAAEAEDRPISAMARKIITDWLKQRAKAK